MVTTTPTRPYQAHAKPSCALENSTQEFTDLSTAYAHFTASLPPPEQLPRKAWLDSATLQAVRTKAALFRQHRQNPQVPSLRLRYTDARRRASKMVREAWSTYWINIGTGISQDFVKGNIGHGLSPISNLVHRRPRLQPQDEVDLIAHTEYVLTNISRVSPDAPPH